MFGSISEERCRKHKQQETQNGVRYCRDCGLRIIDFAIMAVLSRCRFFSSFMMAECAIVPFAVFFLSGVLLKIFGFGVPQSLPLTSTYFLVACVFFSQIEIQKSNTEPKMAILRRSVLIALVFSSLHFMVQYSFA